jgi:predicted secreted protein
VIITTQRPLPIQRFTGAHELGHIVLHHDASFDGDEILARSDQLSNLTEVQANAFASDFLIPNWLPALHGRAQGWNRDSLRDPAIIYQLALRMGASYEATCIALHKHHSIDARALSTLRTVQPKQIKQELVPNYEPPHWHRDIWVLTERDEGSVIEGQPEDLFLFRLNEKSGAGYLWDISELKERGFAIVRDSRDVGEDRETVGDSVQRLIAAQSDHASTGEVVLSLERPWQKSQIPANELHLKYDLRGKEEGLPRAARRQAYAA